MKRLIDGTEPSAAGVRHLAMRALELRAGSGPRQFPGARVVAVFLNPSLRTRTSLEAATGALGAQAIVLSPGRDAWALELEPGAVMNRDRAEHIVDAVRVLSGFGDVLGVRAFAGLVDAEADRRDPVVSAFAEHAAVPVLNLESARWHPLQGLADTATWISHLGPQLAGEPLTLTWAPHPRALPAAVPNQVLLSAALMGMHVTVAHPPGFELDPEIVSRAEGLATSGGGGVRIVHDQAEAMDGARVVVAKSWSGFSGYGRRDDEAEARAHLGGWQVTPDDLALTDAAGFMHCLPVRRNVVVADAVLDGPRCWVYEEAHLRLWTAMAALERVLADGGSPWNA